MIWEAVGPVPPPPDIPVSNGGSDGWLNGLVQKNEQIPSAHSRNNLAFMLVFTLFDVVMRAFGRRLPETTRYLLLERLW